MPTRALVLTALVASCVSSVVSFALARLTTPTPTQAEPQGQAASLLVRTQQLEIVDSTGAARVTIGTAGDRIVRLQMGDPAGRAGIQIGLEDVRLPEGVVTVPTVIAASSSGAQGSLVAGPDGSISWSLVAADPHGVGRGIAAMAVDPDGTPRLRLLGSTAQPIWQAP